MKSHSQEIEDLNRIAFTADESSFPPDIWVAYSNGQLVGHSRRKEYLLKSLDKRDIRKAMIAQVGNNSPIDIMKAA